MKAWVVGAAGMVGTALCEFFERHGISFVRACRETVDITDLSAVRKHSALINPTHIFNCAAMTNVDMAEQNPEMAFAVNATGPYHLALVAKEMSARLVHLSTDYVFSSTKEKPFQEEDETSPINVYGLSKLTGEDKVKEILPSSCIIRTSWVYGGKGKNFISSIAKLLTEKPELQVAFDQKGKPTFCHDLAQAMWELKDHSGVYHFAGSEALSRYEIAQKILAFMQEKGIAIKCDTVVPVPASTFFTPAKRPSYSVLDTTKFEKAMKRVPRSFTETLPELFYEITTT